LSLARQRGGLEDLQHPAALRLLCAGGALVAAGFLLALLSLRVTEPSGWGADRPCMRGVSAMRRVRGRPDVVQVHAAPHCCGTDTMVRLLGRAQARWLLTIAASFNILMSVQPIP